MSIPELFERAARLAHEYRARVGSIPVAPRASMAALRASLGGALTEAGSSEGDTLDLLARAAEPGLLNTVSPRFFGFVIGASAPMGVAADFLTSAWGQNAGLYATSPALAVAEETAARWVLELLGLPPTSSVGFVTGCQMANFTALASARHALLHAAGWDVEEHGLFGAPPVHVVISEEAHVTIPRALRLLGMGQGRVIRVPSDAQGRMRADALEQTLGGLQGPTLVCAQAGNVNTGAVDDLDRIASLCAGRAWLHVDGAFGLWAAASPRLSHLVHGVARADSWATDAHKWLNAPYDSGLVIVKHPAAHKAAMTTDAAYLVKERLSGPGAVSGGTGHEGDSAPPRDAVDWVPEFSRRARGFAVWAQLRTLGRTGVASLVDRCCALASRMAQGLAREAGAEILNDVVLNQVLARFTPASGGDTDAFTREVIARTQREGTCWLGGSVWKGKAVMRVSVSGHATTEEDIDRSVRAIASCAKA
ncbi:MAG: aspartate aminotransferase family protein [Deltaproteobacteria bacterium]|nr:aspartate aminotransferase family protein [Deltaproteobacteria bacterium]